MRVAFPTACLIRSTPSDPTPRLSGSRPPVFGLSHHVAEILFNRGFVTPFGSHFCFRVSPDPFPGGRFSRYFRDRFVIARCPPRFPRRRGQDASSAHRGVFCPIELREESLRACMAKQELQAERGTPPRVVVVECLFLYEQFNSCPPPYPEIDFYSFFFSPEPRYASSLCPITRRPLMRFFFQERWARDRLIFY